MNKFATIKMKLGEDLNIQPLAIAKYFYKRGVISHLVIQKLIYFSFLEGLRNDLFLFREKFQAWKYGPVLRSVFDAMTSSSSLDTLFAEIPSLRQKKVLAVLVKVYQENEALEAWDLVEKSHHGPWQKARDELPETEVSTQEIALEELISFAKA
ncbi:Panacea domain-containing protein [endosymbiont GvMRE of Glomus versiforme]|uniref:Panacea domain-containing protein n=1 Tax=endosymbiont GvMRE of Glomus versiforme TaxID=2039283 RepID=UPI000EDACE00|nr:type II toxin-antitoxin system antitoxin SocA domain-containing protein [endosymbiont GvMRE of Glomus versiforme]RHZ36567.1 Phage-associated protein [endosymbiont GvMRE of Glomus versiforme]